MDQRESDPTGAFSGGAATIDPAKAAKAAKAATDGTDTTEPVTDATGVASGDREHAIDTIAATSDVADPEAVEATAGTGD